MKKKILILALLFVALLSIKSQIPQAPTNLQSPNAASLGLYGEVPVSLFTGIPEISIPLFTAPDKYNNFSLSLSYYAGGVRPDQHPGWVGTNWSLMAGGCISRIKNNLVDEFQKISSTLKLGYYFNYSMFDRNDWNTTSNIQALANNINTNDEKDTEPDEFNFNFLGYTGSFFLNEKGQWVVKSNKPLKVIFDGVFVDQPNALVYKKNSNFCVSEAIRLFRIKTFNSFKIIDDNGVQYIFGNNESAIEYSIPFFDQADDIWTANNWYLTKIIYPNGKSITLNYQRGNLINQMYIFNAQTISQSYTMGSTHPSCYYASNVNDIEKCYNGSLISPVYLTSIVSPDFTINFQTGSSYELRYDNKIYQNFLNQYSYPYDPRSFLPFLIDIQDNKPLTDYWDVTDWQQLYGISIRNNIAPFKSYTFRYNSGAGATGDPRLTSKERLFLKSLTEDNVKKYTFEYDNKDKLPPYFANKTDHWGFYNNKTGDITNVNTYYTNKESDATVMKYGSLKKITYPTGGTTEFEYEANQYSTQLKLNRWEGVDYYSTNKIAGGLRIKKIINTPNNGQPAITKEYFYVKNFTPSNQNNLSSGVLGGQIQYLFNNYQVKNTNMSCLCGGVFNPEINGDLIVNKTIFSTMSVLPLCSNSLGSHIGYSEVVEKLSDGSFSKYKFSNFDNGYLDEQFDNSLQLSITAYQPYTSNEMKRGLLLSKEYFDNNGVIKMLTENIYKKNTNPGYIRTISKNMTTVCSDLALYYLEGTAYKRYLYSMLLDNTKTTYYDNNQQPTLTQTTTYNYNKYNQTIKSSTVNSDGKEYVSRIFYPNEIVSGILPSIQVKDYTSFSNSVIAANCLNPVIATENYVNNNLINGTYNDYTLLPNNTPLLNKVYQSNRGNTYRKVYECNNFDTYGNPLFETLNETTNKVYIWSYNYLYPIAEIQNATYDQIKSILGTTTIESLATSVSPDMTKLSSLRNISTALTTTYSYKPFVGITSTTDTRGVTTKYEYDENNRLTLLRDLNNNVLAKYKYFYGITITEASINAAENPIINTSTSATISITGGSGNFGYNWQLLNGSGTIISSSTNNSTKFDFTCTTTGIYSIKCTITDYNTNATVSVTKSITCVYAPLVVSDITGGFGYLTTNYPFTAYYYSVSATISGGSPSKYCTWTLYDSYPYGNVLNTYVSGTINQGVANWSLYSAPYTTGQTLVLQVRDNILSKTVTVTKTMLKQ